MEIMDSIWFSIMVPVYNVENYLKSCIDSVIGQDYEYFELILIDDGSTDNSGLICDEYQKKDSRIKVFHKENEGLLLTRRFGIKNASYDWLVFLDSDDYWNPGLLKMLADTIAVANPDMVMFNYCTVSDTGKLLKKHEGIFPDWHIIYEKKHEIFYEIANGKRLNSIWIKVPNRRIVDVDADYTKFKDKKGEDILQSLSLFTTANKIVYRDHTMYNYRLSVNGRGRNFKLKYVYDAEIITTQIATVIEQLYGKESSLLKLLLKRYLEKITTEVIKILMYYPYDYKMLNEMHEFEMVQLAKKLNLDKQLSITGNILFKCFWNKKLLLLKLYARFKLYGIKTKKRIKGLA